MTKLTEERILQCIATLDIKTFEWDFAVAFDTAKAIAAAQK